MRLPDHLLLILSGCLFPAALLSAQPVNWSEHIAPIVYRSCTPCHRQGEIGPFPLTSYAETASRGQMIKLVTSIGYMPPWKPDPAYQRYQRENFLTAAQKQQIVDWVDQGMPEGNPALAPSSPVFPGGSQVGVPDKVVSFARKWTVPGNNQDQYRYFVIPHGLTENKRIRALEFRPGNTRIVHHALIWEDTTGEAAAADAATPEYGYAAGSISLSQEPLPGYVPGSRPVVYSNSITQMLHAGGDLKLQLHYAPTPVPESDSSSILIFYDQNTAPPRILKTFVMTPPTLVNGPFVIPANTTREFHGQVTVPFTASVVSVSPHCHKLGTFWKVFARTPQGDTIPFIHIRNWDFNWQGDYQFRRLLKVPAGSVIHAFAGYDNTANNPSNPNNPPLTVTWGEGTGDEMFFLPISFLPYQNGDENLVFEDSLTTDALPQLPGITDKLFPLQPMPATDRVQVGFTLATAGEVSLRILAADGRPVQAPEPERRHLPGYHTRELDLRTLPAGVYLLELRKGSFRQVRRLVKGN